MTSIREKMSQIKQFAGRVARQSDLLLILIILLVAGGSFGLGRLSVTDNTRTEVRIGEIELPSVPAAAYEALQRQKTSEGNSLDVYPQNSVVLVASKSGSAYHFPTCPGAKQMKEENKIYFDSFEAARAAGYRPAQNCPGLE